jgi:hypothetical protein
LRGGRLLTENGVAIGRLCIGMGTGSAPAAAARGGEVLVPTQSSGRKAYLYVQPGASGELEVRKAAGRIHDVALNFEPLGSTARLPPGSCLLAAGTALFGLRHDPETVEVSLLGHWLMEEELGVGVVISSGKPEIDTSTPWIHVAADRPLELTLARE